MASQTYTVAAAAWISSDEKERTRIYTTGDTLELDPTDERVQTAVDKGLLVSGDVEVVSTPAGSTDAPSAEEVGSMSVDEVNTYIADHPEHADEVLAAETSRRNRKGVVGTTS